MNRALPHRQSSLRAAWGSRDRPTRRAKLQGVLASAALLSLVFAGGLFGPERSPPTAQAQPAKTLRCAVELSPRGLNPKTLCAQLGKAIGRPTQVVADARQGNKSDALQIIHDDVQWTLVLLRDGAVRSWTRVSSADARGREVEFFARAVRSLLQTEPNKPHTCVRLEPKSTRGFDLVYPWAELKPCEPRVIEVPDPWWTNA